mmetsp:Transcript_40916/g.98674  ORF Transcript_40916/g.98674 Transcript_40916/m.98674 type:complete len:433 (+) Transcript_40916:101-1399(+)
MEQSTRYGNERLGAYAFPNTNDDFSMEPVASVQADASKPSQRKGTTTPVIFKVESAASSLSSSPSDAIIIRPPCSKRTQAEKSSKAKKKSSPNPLVDSRNDENPVITLQKLMSKKARRRANDSSRMDSEPPRQRQTPFRGSFADIDVRSSRRQRATRPDDRISASMPQRRIRDEKKKPPVYHTEIAFTSRYPQPQDTLDDVFNVLEHAMCPNPAVSMEKDALDTFFGAAEKMVCGPDPRYAYQRKRIESDNGHHQEEQEEKHTLLRKAIEEKHVLTKYPRLIAEGAKSKNYDIVVATAEAASKLNLEAPNTILPPSAKLLQNSNREMVVQQQQQPDNRQDLLDVICNQVEAVTCNRPKKSKLLAHGQQHNGLQNKDVLHLICEGLEHDVCGASLLASEEEMMITFDPEEEKRQALQRLFKPPTRKKGNQPKH